jgi:SAM-dependent methyltransferase
MSDTPGPNNTPAADRTPAAYDPAAYGNTHADVYDRIYPSFPTAAAVARITELTAEHPGPVLDLGIGTGRLARPLRAAGVDVHGIDASPAMIAELRSRPGGADIPVHQADIADFDIDHRYSVIVCAVSTLFMLPDRDRQTACLNSARRHLADGGLLIVEAFVPDPHRYDQDGERVELRRFDDTSFHLVVSTHRSDTQSITITHVLGYGDRAERHRIELHYATPQQLDDMADSAGLALVQRAGSWDLRRYGPRTTDHLSIYRASVRPRAVRRPPTRQCRAPIPRWQVVPESCSGWNVRCALPSVSFSGRYNPLSALAGDIGDQVEVAVVVEHSQVEGFAGGCDEQVGDLAASLAAVRQEALDLQGAMEVSRGGLDGGEDIEGLHELIPLGGVARRVADLEVADGWAGDLASRSEGFDSRAHERLVHPLEDARVDEVR